MIPSAQNIITNSLRFNPADPKRITVFEQYNMLQCDLLSSIDLA